jgi:intraflagellar transport protein 52
MQRRLRSAWKVDAVNEELNDDLPSECRVFVIAGAHAKYSQQELETIRRFLGTGGSVLVMMGEGGEMTQVGIGLVDL